MIFYSVVFSLQLNLWEFKINIFACELLKDTRKSFNLVFRIVLLCFIYPDDPLWAGCHPISCWFSCLQFHLGKDMSSRIASFTVVRVQFLGCFCLFFVWLFWVGLGRILLWTITTVCFPLNFFSNLHTSWAWIFWKDLSRGTVTKIIIAFQPPSTSVSLAAVIISSHKWALRSEFIFSSLSTLEMRDSNTSVFLPLLSFTIFALKLSRPLSRWVPDWKAP